MFEQTTQCFRLDASATISLGELAECCGLSAQELDELVDYRALTPLDTDESERVFSAHWVMPLRTVAKLRVDFDLDLFTVAMVLGQLDRIAQLEQQVQSLQARLPIHLRDLQFHLRLGDKSPAD
jgi:chaperone modulatory protein CbpM